MVKVMRENVKMNKYFASYKILACNKLIKHIGTVYEDNKEKEFYILIFKNQKLSQ